MNRIKQVLGRYRGLRREIYVLFFSRMINSLGAFVFPLLTLILSDKVGLSKQDAGICLTIIALVQVPAMTLGGKLADIFGRKKLIIIFQVLGAAVYIACGLIPPGITLVYLVAAASIFYAMSYPALDSMAMDLTTPSNRKEAFSLLYMGHNLGFSVGVVIGGLLYQQHLPFVFIGDALTTFAAVTLAAIFIPETMPGKSRIVPTHISEERHLEKAQQGSVARVLFKRPILLFFAMTMIIYYFCYSQWGFALPLQMNALFGTSGAQYYGFVAGFNGILVILFTPLITVLTRRFSSLVCIGIGGIVYVAAFALFGISSTLPLFFVGMFVMTMGEIINAVNGSTFIANHSPSSHRGRINSVLPIIMSTGGTLAPLLMGQIIAALGTMYSWFVISGCILVGAVLMFSLNRMGRRTEIHEQVPGPSEDAAL
jgi:MFS family permease